MSALTCETDEEERWGVLDGLPGDPMMWVLILSELVAFGLLLSAFIVARAVNPTVFAAGQAVLDGPLAALNTIVLVTSGWAAARAAAAARRASVRNARRWIALAMMLGAAFIGIKLTEYGNEIASGASLESSVFFTLYFLLTGFHLLHVLLGIVILAIVSHHATSGGVETGAAFWHMVDLVWIVIFPILYLVR
ncbi:NorE protein involved in nitric oxide reduction (Cytochrome c oxidase subunit III-like protein) [Bradyrhizobium sp. ORS 285]|uniref:cytochrome c oxidase subunit 3 n=1 Tax=Bradyrhizobium sp. ORS 285 TaxID=115808 RepID=UPI0002409514|nr:cytochrome c oxidase subunit 3 [Bradyrhizobium sp. ORS 285]CCD87521.1 NorE protein involved in nitric oxide reduction (Cytochrome c oxidase subunit III-like protein) [Bradyrhizobium sp. ORS 285]SMX60326.1 NorE protein involved in nitric oxide reduction (Cytochrome c oxidase subunit III-like protein) [Bradyrhizobium sp. ORS 285]